jgi:molybdopterin-guanine dinucleotide biosynthesis protein A
VNLSGAVLAGGRSSRFGRDKALFPWRGKTLLQHALDGLEICAERFVVGGDYQLENILVHPDFESFAGSLHGLKRALEIARHEHVAVTACDMPKLSSAYWAWLEGQSRATGQGSWELVIPENADGFLEPLAAVYAKTCLEPVNAAINSERLKMTGWWEGTALRVRRLAWLEVKARFGEDVFLNANTMLDLEEG